MTSNEREFLKASLIVLPYRGIQVRGHSTEAQDKATDNSLIHREELQTERQVFTSEALL